MCGATQEQKNLEKEQAAFYAEGRQHAEQTFGQQQELLGKLNSIYEPILAKGPNQFGYSDEELNRLNSQTVEGTAQNFRAAETALKEKYAAEGGGQSPLTSGQEIQNREALAASAAAMESKEQEHVIESGYEQGYNEFQQATKALDTNAEMLNPIGYTSAANESGDMARKTANDIAEANNSWVNAAIGAVGSIGSAVMTGGMSNLGDGKGFFGGKK